MLTDLQSNALNLINQRPRKASELGSMLGIDRRQAGRLGDRLAELGHAARRNDGNGFVYFPANGGASLPMAAPAIAPEPKAIDGHFRDVTQPSTSRELVPSGQPHDSRMQAALRQHSAAERGNGHRPGVTIPTPIVELWNSGFTYDPHGDETLAALAGSIDDAVQAAERVRKADAARALVVAKQPEPRPWEMALGLSALRTFAAMDNDRRRSDGAQPAAKRAKQPSAEPMIDRFALKRDAEDAARAEYEARARRMIRQTLRDEFEADDEGDEEPMDDVTPAPTPTETLKQLLASKPNGHVAPSDAPPDKQPMSLGVKWTLAAGCAAAFVLAVVKFGSGLSA